MFFLLIWNGFLSGIVKWKEVFQNILSFKF